MKIADYHFYHGAALSVLISRNEFTGLSKIPDIGNSYAVNNMVGLHIKHASADSSPWQFNFHPEHQLDVSKLFQRFEKRTYIALVCGRAGICVLPYSDYSDILEEDSVNQKTLTIKKPSGGGFRVAGQKHKLAGVIPINSYPEALFEIS